MLAQINTNGLIYQITGDCLRDFFAR